jgi:response regulator RpfG family c-di-GMP phosphodiesterase
VKKTLEKIREGRGTHFDPELVDIFMGLEPELTKIVDNRK